MNVLIVVLFVIFLIIYFCREKILEREREERWKQLEAQCQGKRPLAGAPLEDNLKKVAASENTNEDKTVDSKSSDAQEDEAESPKTESSTTAKSET